MGRPAEQGKSPVTEMITDSSGIQSSTGHEKSGMKKWEPSQKAKYDLVTDSE